MMQLQWRLCIHSVVGTCSQVKLTKQLLACDALADSAAVTFVPASVNALFTAGEAA
jgi:hypothetical protein